MDYDTWKTMSDIDYYEYCQNLAGIKTVEAEALMGIWDLETEEYREEIIPITVPYEIEEDEDGKYANYGDVNEIVREYMLENYGNCDYELIKWYVV